MGTQVRAEVARKPSSAGAAAPRPRLWERRSFKIASGILAVLLWFPLIFILLIVLGINPIFTRAVRELGFRSLHVPVMLHRASVSFSGKLVLDRFRIANPASFSPGEAVSIQGLYAEVPLGAIFKHEIDIPVLTVDHPVFNLEFGGPKESSNWAVIMNNLAESLPRKERTPSGKEETARRSQSEKDDERSFKIQELKILSPTIRYQSPTFPKGIDLHLKDVELRRVGNAPGSRSKLYLVFASIFQALLTGGIQDKHLPSDVAGRLSQELAAASKAFGSYLDSTR